MILFFEQLQAQAQKGDWLIRGNGSTVSQNVLVRSSSNFQFDIALGYFINQRWMLGAGVGIQLTEFSSSVGNELFGRYYFKDSIRAHRFYLEGRWERTQFAPIGAGQSTRRFNFASGILAIGYDFFLSEQLAIETQLDYYFLNRFKRFDDRDMTRPDFFTIGAKLQYFFRYRDHRQERLIDYRKSLKKGTWFVGGQLRLREHQQLRLFDIQKIEPEAGVFFRQNWALGTGFTYNATAQYNTMSFGLNPFTRYYLNINRKKKIYLDIHTGYRLSFSRLTKEEYVKSHGFNYGVAIGWSNFISKEVSFDIAYVFTRHFQYDQKLSKGGALYDEKGFTMAVQYFWHQ